jgi:hypothetical protein
MRTRLRAWLVGLLADAITQANQNQTVVLKLNERELGRAVHRAQVRHEQRRLHGA